MYTLNNVLIEIARLVCKSITLLLHYLRGAQSTSFLCLSSWTEAGLSPFLGRGGAETSIQNSNMVDSVKDLAFENACTAVFLLLDSSISSGKVKNPSSHSVFYLLQLKLRIQTGDQLENQRDESTMQGFRIK